MTSIFQALIFRFGKTDYMKKNLLIAFGLLDLISFILSFKIGINLLNSIGQIPILSTLEIILIVSLIASGIFSIMRKKISLIIYYIQFPLKLGFVILSFAFLFRLFGFQYDSIEYRFLLWFIALLEIARLIFSIMIHKREFRNK
jgi:hypothetical protein